ncbi:MAG TPA: PP2C family protein-serine/threonine phosphatase [Verrucomicrobiae bacterium]|nr:PP2C family protein-serine/threonine phosphatase [Verrucomicrobiae bacterium]
MARRSSTPRTSYEYFRDVPLRRLTFLLLAIFCLFGMLGFLIDLIELRQKSLAEVLVWTIFTGGMAVFYLLTIIRSPRWLLFPIAIHVAGSLLIRVLIVPSVADSAGKPIDVIGIRMAAVASLALSVLAGGLFLQFIRSEGRRAVRLQTELSVAHGIQKTLVPVIEKTAIGCEFYGVSVPSDKVGGDLVDVVELKEGQIFAYVADIAGHGLPAGILMAMFKTAARTQLMDSPRLPAFLERLNEVLPQVKEPEMFATCAAILLKRTNAHFTLEYSSAGHPPILMASRSSQCVERLAEPQFPLGLVASVSYASRELQVEPGDLFLITSDGIIETHDSKGSEFGIERIEGILLQEISSPLPQIARNLLSAVSAFGNQADDQTILLFRVLL